MGSIRMAELAIGQSFKFNGHNMIRIDEIDSDLDRNHMWFYDEDDNRVLKAKDLADFRVEVEETDKAWDEGWTAYENRSTNNPYPKGSRDNHAWDVGWSAAYDYSLNIEDGINQQ